MSKITDAFSELSEPIYPDDAPANRWFGLDESEDPCLPDELLEEMPDAVTVVLTLYNDLTPEEQQKVLDSILENR